MYTQTEKVNIEPKSYLPVFRVSQNDVGRTLKAHLVSDEGTITIPTSATVTMAGIKPSGLGYTVTGTIAGSDVTFETDATMTDEAGQIESEIRIVDGETLIGTTNVVLNVEPNPHPDDTTDGQCEPLVNEITALLNQITAQADRVEEYSSKVLNMTVSAHESQEPTVTKTEGEVVNLDFGLPRGEKGERGERGEQGEAGKDGKDGIDGKDGKDGINGVTPDFSIGTVTTLEPNESASVTLTGTEEEPVLNFGIPRGVKGEQGEVSLSDLEKIMVTDTASGAIASFPDGSDLLPALSLVANIVPKQSGSGTPSPDNIRPISGWESVETVVGGFNRLSLDRTLGTLSGGDASNARPFEYDKYYVGFTATNYYYPYNVSSYQVADETVSVNPSSNGYGVGFPIKCFPNVAYYCRFTETQSAYVAACFYDKDGKYISYVDNNQSFAFTTPNNCETALILFRPPAGSTTTFSEINVNVSDTNLNGRYEPYIAPTTHTTSLGRTVYGGTVDVVSGVLTDKLIMVTDFSNISMGLGTTSQSGKYRLRLDNMGVKPTASPSVVADNLYCNVLGALTANNTYTATQGVSVDNNGYIYIYVEGLDTVENYRAWLIANNVQLCYELSTPTTYQLTPQQINTLAGVNNVWVDSGDVTIEYYADIKLYIDKKLGGN